MRDLLLSIAIAVGVACCLAATIATVAAASAPAGNAEGLALLARVHRAYEPVPAISATGQLGALRVRFTLLLRRGVVTGEEFFGIDPTGTTTLVATGAGPTFAREPGTACWRKLSSSDSQSLEDVGSHFPDAYGVTVEAPMRDGSTWLLPEVTRGRYSGERSPVTLRIDAKTMRVMSETSTHQGHTVTEHVQRLARLPVLPLPTPAC